ncbi:hypothetical protein [Taibaiella soli]|uniref:Uncharacterized protein n=1 Tax=Taibaiella soli TaxID=1649169 RepID=A0A2W2AEN3_9BACT|nr:hypothetical protein [Taibaiella soli]PZF73935.1 hypothetical protein DN068_06235 [Taibaiella soli]
MDFVDYNRHTHIPQSPMTNPFESLEHKLARIETLLESRFIEKTEKKDAIDHTLFMPVQDVYPRYCSRQTFYNHVKNGMIKLYKFGNRSFVKRDEFFATFKEVKVAQSLSNLKTHKTKEAHIAQ